MTSGKLHRAILWGLSVIAILSTLSVAGLTGFVVVARFAHIQVVGLYELVLMAAVMMYMSGAVIAALRRSHLTVDFLEGRITAPRSVAIHRLVIALITTAITAIFVYWTWTMFQWAMVRPQHTPALSIPLWLPQSSMILGSVGCLLLALRDVVVAVRQWRAA